MEWISVDKKLPNTTDAGGYNKSDVVAVLVDGKHKMTAELNEGRDEVGNEWYQWFNFQYEDVIENVTHWTELPQIPD